MENLDFPAIFSIYDRIILHGPHHDAQKYAMTIPFLCKTCNEKSASLSMETTAIFMFYLLWSAKYTKLIIAKVRFFFQYLPKIIS